ncbi:TonB-dependent receptor domain-containing protein [Malaciobacter mytili]|uniref:TonB-dependent siderophore receptor n=1 Tax=Malaciobacter mytili LMG 24559 TaxID=1032238 RepID=A0AAX2AGX7_9BACT|nr:TonB-dependent receptor [Malaciobacter mytili]AXH14680.1 TonB-dependent receptor [Malaciobacter mytili LMG 24559]RXI43266.1 TonB-dependent siderophore receptor [Malaciobacter mytili]RXK16232.1 TonB-dependent siderophore receptor [Malaciobacter mytili LMG 24559]
MKNNKILLSSFAAISIFCTHAIANDSAKLNSVDVWETEVVSSSLNLGKDAIETKQADHLSDLLRDLPGVEVGGTHSINNRINIRGLQDEDLDITIDGAKVQNANMFHHIGNLLINPDILKKADIQVGTNSVVSGSLGGSIAFETKDGKDMLQEGQKYGARISTTYNSNNSTAASIAGYGKVTDNFSFLLYHNYINKDNWKYPSGERTFGIEGKNHNTLVKGTYNISDNQSISISYDKLTDKGDYLPRPDMNADANSVLTGKGVTFDTEYERETITLKHKLDLGKNLKLDTTLYSNNNEINRDEAWSGARSPRPDFKGTLEGEVKTIGLNTKAQSNLETGSLLHTLTYGALFDKQTSKVKWNGNKYGKDEKANTFAIYLENAIDFNNGFVLTPGVRYTNYKLDGSYGDINDNELTYGLAAEYALTDTITLLASATTLYKGVPMVDVLASNRTSMLDSESLKAETGINKEVGFRYINDNVLGADKVGLSFKYFRTQIDDVIESLWSGNSAYMVNNGDLEIKGFEASFKYIKGDFSSLFAFSKSNTEYSKTKLSSDYEAGDKFTIGLNYKVTPAVDFSWNSIFVKSEKNIGSLAGIDHKPGYAVHNMAVKYVPQLNKNLTILAGVDNIFNKEYISHTSRNDVARGTFLGDYEPGRNFKVTLSYKF